jgi:hypothetical protein
MLKLNFSYNVVCHLSLPNHLHLSFILCISNHLHSAGTDVAGEIVEVGQGVQKFKTGEKVVSMVNPAVSCLVYLLVLPLYLTPSVSLTTLDGMMQRCYHLSKLT